MTWSFTAGTPGGIAASVMAAREGARVLLIEPTRHVGGMSTSGLNTAETEHMLDWTLGGFADEFYRRLGAHYGLRDNRPAYEFESGVAEKTYLAMLREADVEVRFGASLKAATVAGGRISLVTGVMNYNLRLTVTRDPAVRVPFPKPKRYDPARYRLLSNWLKAQEGTDVMKE